MGKYENVKKIQTVLQDNNLKLGAFKVSASLLFLAKNLEFQCRQVRECCQRLKQDFTADLKYNDNGDCSYVFIRVIDDLPVSQPAFSSSKSKISIRTMCEICLKLTIKTLDRCY